MTTRGRPRTFDRDTALAAAMVLFWEKGYTATSMADLYEGMGISSPSLYAAFGSKQALYAEALGRYDEIRSPVNWGPLESQATARQAIEAFLLASARSLTDPAQPRGCMVTLSAVGSEGEEVLGREVAALRALCLRTLETRLKKGIAAGELPKSTDVKGLARMFVAVQQGMSIQARDGASRRDLEGAAKAAMAAWPVQASAATTDSKM